VRLFGAADPVTGGGIEQVMAVQLQYSFFPVREAEMKAAISYQGLTMGLPVEVNDAIVTSTLLNHPVINLGYRIACNGKSLFFTGDHEPHYNIYEPGDAEYAEYQVSIEDRRRTLDDAMRGVDALIVDCSYTREEYPTKKGWGHGYFDAAIAMALRVGAKQLYCTHHEPTRSDDELDKIFADVMARHAGQLGSLQVHLAQEGMEVELSAR
jgi:phosphoribosyl 1,2-cyclic phosphodiesterase